MLDKITWFGHTSFKIKAPNQIIYIDPWEISGNVPADAIIVTHEHFDHLSVPDIDKIYREHTKVLTVQSCIEQLESYSTQVISPGDEIDLNGVHYKFIPAYTIDKEYHPKENGWVGIVISFDGESIYYAGDTDVIDEMNDLAPDVALLPIGGTYTMDATEAARAVDRIKPKLAVPMHYGKIVGGTKDAEKFKEIAGCPVTVLSL